VHFIFKISGDNLETLHFQPNCHFKMFKNSGSGNRTSALRKSPAFSHRPLGTHSVNTQDCRACHLTNNLLSQRWLPEGINFATAFNESYFTNFKGYREFIVAFHYDCSTASKEFVIIRIPSNRRVFVKTGPVLNYCMMCGNCLQNQAICPTLLPPRIKKIPSYVTSSWGSWIAL
jgi:hypothetical protein